MALIIINITNDSPVANPDTYSAPKSAKTTIRVMESDMDINGDSIILVSYVYGIGSVGAVTVSTLYPMVMIELFMIQRTPRTIN